jgi:alanine racemase
MDGTRAIIHLENLRHNLRELRRMTGNKAMCLAVKADAYGHGALEVSRTALAAGVSHLGVARIAEAIELRKGGITAAILLFSAADPADFPAIVEQRIQPFVPDADSLRAMAETADPADPLRVHIKVDTGMGRIGCSPSEAVGMARFAAEHPALLLEGIATHFPMSDDPDDPMADSQLEQMRVLRRQLSEEGIEPGYYHAANSGGILFHQDDGLNMVRPGISAYGYAPDARFADELGSRGVEVKAVMELQAAVSFVKRVKKGTGISYGHIWHAPRDTWIATLNAGYADGYPRINSGRTRVSIRGGEYPQVGRICMDQCMVDLGPGDPEVRPGDLATLFGPSGPEDAASIAEKAGTISYEITCGITRRVPREYLD